MKKLVLTIVLLILGIAGGSMLLSWRRGAHWTTSSKAALKAFEDCLDSAMKVYNAEALAQCERALELDPGFVIAKLRVAQWVEEETLRDRLVTELREVDLEALTPRERFLVEHSLAETDHDDELAGRLLESYLERHPDDPFALERACMAAWYREDWDEAAACQERLLEVDPNWVRAQNHRGYLAMSQGRFDEAEEHFRTYLYIAPDQANPHDSLAELLTLRGRYVEAESALAEALRIRADFCPAYVHLVTLHLMQGAADRALEATAALEREGACGEMEGDLPERLRCAVAVWGPALGGDWEAAWTAAIPCLEGLNPDAVIVGHRAAIRTGRRQAAIEVEERVAAQREGLIAKGRRGATSEASAMLAHTRGTRLMAEGEQAAAAAEFDKADLELRYWDGLGVGAFKLYNLGKLASALEAAGRSADAMAAWERLEQVNPAFAGLARRSDAP